MTKVLCVDDSTTMRKMVIHTLLTNGYECCEAIDGKDALAVVARERPDLIITDYNMPIMNGLEFTAAVRALEAHRFTPILLLTTETSETLRKTAREYGATGWMVKPFNPDKLLRTLEKVLLN